MTSYKTIAIEFVVILIALVLVTAYGIYRWNQPISGLKWEIISKVCNVNGGLREVRRSYLNPKEFIVTCKDSATFNNVAFYLPEPVEQRITLGQL